ncbi:MAG: hypothetical protein Q9M37_10305 [Desulfonauticus sp.]|nr:hypothetical protein [Desulfonauticus sp.]
MTLLAGFREKKWSLEIKSFLQNIVALVKTHLARLTLNFLGPGLCGCLSWLKIFLPNLSIYPQIFWSVTPRPEKKIVSPENSPLSLYE